MINLYGILISLSILSCIFIVKGLVEKNEKDFVWNLAVWATIGGLIGARIYHVISDFHFYEGNLAAIFNVRNGGLGIWGAVFGGILGIFFCTKKYGKNFSYWISICAVSIPLGQAIGRWGNFFNKELFGAPTTLPWGIYIDGQKHHPLFLYESILNLINFFVLYGIYKKTNSKLKTGEGLKTYEYFFVALFLLNYSIIRFFMEFLRTDSWMAFGLNVSFLIPILIFTASLVYLLKFRRNKI